MNHYILSRQERTQIDGRWHGSEAPLCGTGDGHYKGHKPVEWTGDCMVGRVDCPRCNESKHLVARRESSRIQWN